MFRSFRAIACGASRVVVRSPATIAAATGSIRSQSTAAISSVIGSRRIAAPTQVAAAPFRRPTTTASFVVPKRKLATFSSLPLGVAETLQYRIQFKTGSGDGGEPISPWHDIPLFAERTWEERGLCHYINEIPRGTRPKMEIATGEPQTPIKQDVKKGALRYFTYGDIPFNYGCLPQTWEDPTHADPLTGMGGDNDPLDVCEISESPLPVGTVITVKVLGIMALIDEGETDWKVIAINNTHPLAPKLWDISDVDRHLPQVVPTIRNWFKMYKTTDGKPENQFGLNGEAVDKNEAMRVIRETHHSWRDLVTGKLPRGKLWLPQTPKFYEF